MTGMRREIARHVVHNILDTLGNNDYVNIFTFSNTTDPLVECFDNILVQANLANVRLLKESMSEFRTEQIANFSLALTTAFELLQEYRLKKRAANCNQAIMLITDGVQYNFKEIFSKYNWQNLPFMPVRVFTYLIGREVSDVREVKWMACANQGTSNNFTSNKNLFASKNRLLRPFEYICRGAGGSVEVHSSNGTSDGVKSIKEA